MKLVVYNFTKKKERNSKNFSYNEGTEYRYYEEAEIIKKRWKNKTDLISCGSEITVLNPTKTEITPDATHNNNNNNNGKPNSSDSSFI